MKVTVYTNDEDKLTNERNYPDNLITYMFRGKPKVTYHPKGLDVALKMYNEKNKDSFRHRKDIHFLESYFRDKISLRQLASKHRMSPESIRSHIKSTCDDLSRLRCYKTLILTGNFENPDDLYIDDIKNIYLDAIDCISPHTYNALYDDAARICKLGHLTDHSLGELIQIRNFGMGSVKEVVEAMKFYGLTFGLCMLAEEEDEDINPYLCVSCPVKDYCEDPNKRRTSLNVYDPKKEE